MGSAAHRVPPPHQGTLEAYLSRARWGWGGVRDQTSGRGKVLRSVMKDTAEAEKWEVSGSIDDCDQAEIGSVWLWVWRWSPTFSGGKSLSISCLHTFVLAASVTTGRSCCWTGPSRHWNSTKFTKFILKSPILVCVESMSCFVPSQNSICPPETHSRTSDWRVLFQNRHRCWSVGRSLAQTC